ncbi:MAG: LacI family DNA-binding transcriptional regulator [Candidatus Limnocylindrales bacterium]
MAPVTIEDVAEAADVSTATVSRALRGLPHVSPATRARVTAIAVELGYVASKSASNLATGRTSTVGVVTPHVARWFFAKAIEAVESELRERGYDVLLLVLPPGTVDTRVPFAADRLRHRVDAVAVMTVPMTGTELDALRRLRLPTVFIGGSVTGVMSVRIDDLAVGRIATEHLISLGHRKIGHINGDPDEPVNSTAPVDRRAGWRSALRSAGLPVDPHLDVSGHFTVEGGREAMQHLLALDDPPTAVFAASDEMAFGALAAAREAGIDVPGRLSIIGVDDHDLAVLWGLTTVRQPVREQGRTAAAMLLRALRTREPTRRPTDHVLLDVELVTRTTTGPRCD